MHAQFSILLEGPPALWLESAPHLAAQWVEVMCVQCSTSSGFLRLAFWQHWNCVTVLRCLGAFSYTAHSLSQALAASCLNTAAPSDTDVSSGVLTFSGIREAGVIMLCQAAVATVTAELMLCQTTWSWRLEIIQRHKQPLPNQVFHFTFGWRQCTYR